MTAIEVAHPVGQAGRQAGVDARWRHAIGKHSPCEGSRACFSRTRGGRNDFYGRSNIKCYNNGRLIRVQHVSRII